VFRTVPLLLADSLFASCQQTCMAYTIAVCTVKKKHVEFYSKNKFEKLVHLLGFIIKIYHDARSPERQMRNISPLCLCKTILLFFFIGSLLVVRKWRGLWEQRLVVLPTLCCCSTNLQNIKNLLSIRFLNIGVFVFLYIFFFDRPCGG